MPGTIRKPHSGNAGYVTERKMQAYPGYVVIYDRDRGFDIDADYRWIVMHEPTSLYLNVPALADARRLMEDAVCNPEEVFGEGCFAAYPDGWAEQETQEMLERIRREERNAEPYPVTSLTEALAGPLPSATQTIRAPQAKIDRVKMLVDARHVATAMLTEGTEHEENAAAAGRALQALLFEMTGTKYVSLWLDAVEAID